jgi:hypothetical protein
MKNKEVTYVRPAWVLMMMMIIIIMSVGWDYVSELRPPKGLFFIPRMIYEQREPRWNDANKENSWFFHHSSLAVVPSHPIACRSDGRQEWEFGLAKYFYSHLQMIVSCRKNLSTWDFDFISFRWIYCGFLSPLKIHRLCRVWTLDTWVYGKHANHYTTEATQYDC